MQEAGLNVFLEQQESVALSSEFNDLLRNNSKQWSSLIRSIKEDPVNVIVEVLSLANAIYSFGSGGSV